jgi:hypothetical protein
LKFLPSLSLLPPPPPPLLLLLLPMTMIMKVEMLLLLLLLLLAAAAACLLVLLLLLAEFEKIRSDLKFTFKSELKSGSKLHLRMPTQQLRGLFHKSYVAIF